MQLSQLLPALRVKQVIGNTQVDITGFAMDSRQVRPGFMYVVLTEPELQDRTQFVSSAIEAGASAILVNHELPDVPTHIPQVIVPETQIASAYVAAQFYGHPARRLALIGVTGTKGKTTTSYLIRHLLAAGGISTGVIGTTGARFDDFTEPSNTTPHAINLQRILQQMETKGCQAVSMEVSSHALRLHRTAGLEFNVAVFTNIGSDHMNFHRDMDDYIQAKSMLMSKIVQGAAVLNADDPYMHRMLQSAACEPITYGLSSSALFRATHIRYSTEGTRFTLETPYGTHEVATKLVGMFNVYNCLAALGAACGCGVDLATATSALTSFSGVAGRMESVDTQGKGFGVYVDYAHTPESMLNILQTLAETKPHKLITVFGCGGDRDKTKRPKMAAIAARFSAYTVVTSDNPRTEDPMAILADIEAGFREDQHPGYEVIADRAKAIVRAVAMAEPGDIVAILGKGDETYQEINHIRYPFDDREVARAAIAGKM